MAILLLVSKVFSESKAMMDDGVSVIYLMEAFCHRLSKTA